mmetsp:Transcript_41439/g.104498  ORF Transcript_41439/g.104498 Transcript_41439/m.104498 type:complete len:223 (+) Transcript_41439:1249-1917(+)
MSTLMLLPSACMRDQPNSSHAELLMAQILPLVSMMTVGWGARRHSAMTVEPGPCTRDLRSWMDMVPLPLHSSTASSQWRSVERSNRSPSASFHFMDTLDAPTSFSILLRARAKEMDEDNWRRNVLLLWLIFSVMVFLPEPDTVEADLICAEEAECSDRFDAVSSSSLVSECSPVLRDLRRSSMAATAFLRYPILVRPRYTRSSSSSSSSSLPPMALSLKALL